MMRSVFVLVIISSAMVADAQSAKPAPKKVEKKETATAYSRGKLLYAAYCLACHQADGSGVPNLNPPLIDTKWVTGSKATLIGMVLKGSKGQVEIDGETFHNTMPAQAQLTDQQIADVLTYIRNSFGNKSSAVTTAEVKSVRSKIK
jgi:mono/diheme cytochrome c family protein